jgi:hypothetical protein
LKSYLLKHKADGEEGRRHGYFGYAVFDIGGDPYIKPASNRYDEDWEIRDGSRESCGNGTGEIVYANISLGSSDNRFYVPYGKGAAGRHWHMLSYEKAVAKVPGYLEELEKEVATGEYGDWKVLAELPDDIAKLTNPFTRISKAVELIEGAKLS